METRSFIIQASKKSMVEEQLTKLNKRAKKLELEEIVWTWGKARMEEREVLWQNPDYPDMAPQYVTKDILVIPIDVSGPMTVAYDGWTFIATLQHLPTGENIIRSISDEVDIPVQYRNVGSECDHCKVNRYRKDTYLVQHEDGHIVQVGSTCIKDFLGGNSPDKILGKASYLAELLTFLEGAGSDGGYGGGGERLYYINEFLALTGACIRDHGWLSKSKAEEFGKTPTVTHVQNNLSPTPGLRREYFSHITDADREKADKAVAWVESLSDEETNDNDYLYNIRAIARSGMVGWRTMGYAASILAAYDRTINGPAEKKDKLISQHVGTIKKREQFDLTLRRHLSFDSAYGVVHRYIFVDPNGNVMVWKASREQDLEEGKRYLIKGTVTAHGEYKEVKQTEMNRCEIMVSY